MSWADVRSHGFAKYIYIYTFMFSVYTCIAISGFYIRYIYICIYRGIDVGYKSMGSCSSRSQKAPKALHALCIENVAHRVSCVSFAHE